MSRTPSHRGFTLVEMALASVIGAAVLLGCFSVFAASSRMDRAFNNRFERSNDLHITQMTMRRAFLALQMEENQAPARGSSSQNADAAENEADTEDATRARMILDLDGSAGRDASGWTPQRFELVLATPPIAMNLAAQAGGWIQIAQQNGSLDFSSPDGSGGVMRSVFELRPTNTREEIMLRTGLIDSAAYASMTGIDPRFESQTQDPSKPAEGWTLWWRPILGAEAAELQAGFPPYMDAQGTTEQIRTRLAGAIPVARGIQRARWQIYKGDEMVDVFAASTMSDLPAYAVFELQMLTGQYATWMFEIDWVLGEDPAADAGAGSDEEGEGDDTGDGGNGGGNGGDNTNDGRPDRPGGRPGGGLQQPDDAIIIDGRGGGGRRD